MITEAEVEAAVGALVTREGGAPDGWSVQIVRYLTLLLEWNEKVNLVSRRSVDRILESQLRPSLAPLLLVPPRSVVRVLDVGSGGGFPGIPLKVLRPHVRLDLIEARRKKCRFLTACVRELDLGDTEVHWCRVEAPSPALMTRKPFDLVLARGVGDFAGVACAVRPLLAPEGEAWVFADPDRPDSGGASSERIWEDESGSPLTSLRRAGSLRER